MSIKISASANGGVTPPVEDDKNFVSGDFLIFYKDV